MADIEVRPIAASDAHDLRRRILRQGTRTTEVANSRDAADDAWHLGAFRGPRLVGTVSFYLGEPAPFRSGRRSARFRSMAVDTDLQRLGIGRRLLDEALPALRRRGVETVWANGRDTALGFYRGYGFEVAGDGFVDDHTGLPHHVVLMDLTDGGPTAAAAAQPGAS